MNLDVFSNGIRVGGLEANSGIWAFRYAPTWDGFALSPNFPIVAGSFQDNADIRQVEWFFENLLPEGRMRDLIANRDRIDPRDTWALLVRHGRDTAGGLSLLPASLEVHAPGEVLVPLAAEDLQRKIQESRTRNLPLMASWDEVRMSLAGAQEKLGLVIDSRGGMFLPEGTAPSTHIIKPDNASADFPFCPANEFFCMRLAQVLKLPVPDVDLRHLPEPLYVVTRFDRESVLLDGQHRIRRLHQIDLCQALGVSPARKYESEGGLGLHDLLKVLHSSYIDRPIVAVNAVLQWVAFNYLVGNLDAHAKNVAFLAQGRKAAMAPFYDILCVEAYLPRATMSMSIAGENKPGWVESVHWDALAYEAGVAPRLMRGILSKMIADLPDGMARVIGDQRFMVDERKFLRGKVLPVIEERIRFAADAIKSRPSPLSDLIRNKALPPEVQDRLGASISK
jgi:serine/threonine-protein kinase HipA